jgi:outer membrane receptor for Fe3+-dicitrate
MIVMTRWNGKRIELIMILPLSKVRANLSVALILLLFSLSSYAQDSTESSIKNELDQLKGLSIQELMQIKILTPATLTYSNEKLVPAAITVIDQKDIKGSGASTLNELLQIYVPGLQLVRNQWLSRLPLLTVIHLTAPRYVPVPVGALKDTV